MRIALWLLALFGVAVSVALGLSQQFGTVTFFVPPYRVDLSLNLMVLGILLGFALLYAAMRSVFSVLELPAMARRWRAQQRERVAQTALLQALVWWMTGRFTRSRKAALLALGQVEGLLSLAPPDNQASLGLMRSL
ncbi:MAG: heme biosynthesis protein HemY, partial [Betaproteobacteria bacterium]|nr:heme biosynthesis protein HemY [Betaproteobacteria bacterium]